MNMSKNNRDKDLPIIGSSEWVDIGKYRHVPAKTDTGAQSSTIWASDICVEKDGTLKFKLFDKGYYLYTGKVFKRTPQNYKVGIIRSSNGQEQIRYRVYLPVTIAGKKISALFSLADRSKSNFPILIGRRTIVGKFIVNPAIQNVRKISVNTHNPATDSLNQKLAKDPYKFHQEYVINKK
ncbi:ATP-dependent zinc protease [Candidatus Saccharibacteria bacterium]|nr:ATP-dependent zinc protease [Candidatus Saccharibacteria bacterium]